MMTQQEPNLNDRPAVRPEGDFAERDLRLVRDVALACLRAGSFLEALRRTARLLQAFAGGGCPVRAAWPGTDGDWRGMELDRHGDFKVLDPPARERCGEGFALALRREPDNETIAQIRVEVATGSQSEAGLRAVAPAVVELLQVAATNHGRLAAMVAADPAPGTPPAIGDLPLGAVGQLCARLARKQTILETVPTAIFETDAAGRVIYASSSAEGIFGRSGDDWMGKSLLSELAVGEPALARSVWKGLLKSPAREGVCLPLRTRDGGVGQFEIRVARCGDGNGRADEYVCLIHDVSELHRLVDELDSMNSQLQQALRQRERFLACMSHELRTPLNSILGFSEILADETHGPLNPEQVNALKFIDESGRHLLDLVSDILDTATMEAGGTRLHAEPADLGRLLATAVRMSAAAAGRKQVMVELTGAPAGEALLVDSRRLLQVLVNLLDNAVKFSPAGAKVTLRAWREGEDTCLEVADDGPGIAAGDQDTIFLPFRQVDDRLSRRQGGTGLGLYLVRLLCHLMGGSVRVESSPGAGARFTVRLPLKACRQEASATEERPAGVPRPRAEQKKLLVVEDDFRNRLLLTTYLKAKGYAVLEAENGELGIEMALREQPALILMDVRMPVLDGIRATERLTGRVDTAHIPIVTVTAQAMTGDAERCLAAGAREYLTKPVNLRALEAAVNRHLPNA